MSILDIVDECANKKCKWGGLLITALDALRAAEANDAPVVTL